MWTRRTLVIVIALALCSSCSEDPVENLHPAKTIRIFGAVDRSLTIKVKTLFVTIGNGCSIRSGNLVAGWIEGAGTPGTMWAESSVQRVGDTYQAHVAMDRFVDGKCHWRPQAIGFEITNRGNLTTGVFNPLAGHVAGPDQVLWIAESRFAAGTANAWLLPDRQTVECRRSDVVGDAGIECANTAARDAAIVEGVREVQIDVHDLTEPG